MDATLTPSPSANPVTPPVAPAGAEGDGFVDRRRVAEGQAGDRVARERRQFTNSHEGFSPEAAELANAIDAYKLRHRRRFINYEEMLTVLKGLGYAK